jgi:hypothetical protein
MSTPIIDRDGNQLWYNERDRYHREDGPAYIRVMGIKHGILMD